MRRLGCPWFIRRRWVFLPGSYGDTDETIAAPRQSLDPGPPSRDQRQRAPQRSNLNREIAVLDGQALPGKIDEIFLANQLPRSLDQHEQNGNSPLTQGQRVTVVNEN